MDHDKNENGVIQYPKGDIRRLFVLIAAIDKLKKDATLVNLARYTGHNKGTISTDIAKINEQLGLTIIKDGAQYSIKDWGDKIKKTIKKDLTGKII